MQKFSYSGNFLSLLIEWKIPKDLQENIMGWWDKIKDKAVQWGAAVWNNASFSNGVTSVANFSYRTISEGLELIPAIPRTAVNSVFTPRIRRLLRGAGRILVEDVAVLALVDWVYANIQDMGQDYLDEHREPSFVSASTTIQLGLWGVSAAYYLYSYPKRAQTALRIAILVMDSSNIFDKDSKTPTMTLCESHGIKGLLEGSSLGHYSSLLALSPIRHIPIVGEMAHRAGATYLKGRYILTLTTPRLCGIHQEEYRREYPELALSLGIAHELLTCLTLFLMESSTDHVLSYLGIHAGIPSQYYAVYIDSLLMIAMVAITSQRVLPPPVEASQRARDPIELWERTVIFLVDALIIGLRKKLPPLFKDNPAPLLPWKEIPGRIQALWFHPHFQNYFKPLLPSLFHDLEHFKRDPVIPWASFRNRVIKITSIIEDIHEKAKPVLLLPTSATTNVVLPPIASYFGVPKLPKFLVELLLNLLGNSDLYMALHSIRTRVEAHYPGERPSLPRFTGFPLHRGLAEIKGQPQDLTVFADKGTLDPHLVIPLPIKSAVKIEEIEDKEKKDSVDTFKQELTPDMVISTVRRRRPEQSNSAMESRPSHGGIFKTQLDPKLILAPRGNVSPDRSSLQTNSSLFN
ncbi:hypothetical protein [Legionella jordanis]|nr:hypothetical protein [Legionella jordanis]RMX02488.1 hypothetical protein EAW55_09590 [Legionella jordanis]RMX21669.1 hypothetical protein EAS68_02630 [Legionella jordanis]HAT8713778.1 hypothetical protein [Legionella jordanis]